MPVVLLCHCDGTNGSTTFVDSSPSAHVLTAAGVAVTTTSSKFGTGSGDFSVNLGGNVSPPVGSAADFNVGAGQFTLEAFGYFTTLPGAGTRAVMAQFGGASNLAYFFGHNAGAFGLTYSTAGSGTAAVQAAFTPTLTTWYHLAVDRDAANVVRVYVNGVVTASATLAAAIFASTQGFRIGNDQNGTRNFSGYLDEIRVSIGIAQYGGAFTPPSAPFGGVTAAQAIAMVLA